MRRYEPIPTRIRRTDAAGISEAPYRQMAQQVKLPCERLRLALESGLQVTGLWGDRRA